MARRLEYAAMGHLQAVLDEYFHILKDWRGFLTESGPAIISDLAETATSALSLRTVNYATDIPTAETRRSPSIGTRCEADSRSDSETKPSKANSANNAPNRQAKRSTRRSGRSSSQPHRSAKKDSTSTSTPMRSCTGTFPPTRSTSSNAKGASTATKATPSARTSRKHAAPRRSTEVIATHGSRCSRQQRKWPSEPDGELAPYWVFCPPGANARIERYVPVLPLSRDASKLERLLKAVATYRLSFGQPRQEELLKYLAGRIPEPELLEIVQRLRVDLTPR